MRVILIIAAILAIVTYKVFYFVNESNVQHFVNESNVQHFTPVPSDLSPCDCRKLKETGKYAWLKNNADGKVSVKDPSKEGAVCQYIDSVPCR